MVVVIAMVVYNNKLGQNPLQDKITIVQNPPRQKTGKAMKIKEQQRGKDRETSLVKLYVFWHLEYFDNVMRKEGIYRDKTKTKIHIRNVVYKG